jgi:hypothetical protein
MALKIFKSELIQINIEAASTSTKFFFPDNAVIRTTPLQKVKTKGLEFFPFEAVPAAPDQSAVLPIAALQQGFCTLYVNDGEFYTIPLVRMVTISDGSYPFIFDLAALADLDVNYAKSFVFFPTAPAPVAASALLLCVYYEYYAPGASM